MLTIREQLKIYGELAMFGDEAVRGAEQAKPDIRKIRSQHMRHEAAMISDCLKLLGVRASWEESPGSSSRSASFVTQAAEGQKRTPSGGW